MPEQDSRDQHAQQISDLLDQISALSAEFALIERTLTAAAESPFNEHSLDHWARFILQSAVKRILIFQERNFTYIETLGLLSLTRYIFELAVWIRLIAQDRRFVFAYYDQLSSTMERYHKDQANHLTREAELFKRVDKEESRALSDKLTTLLNRKDQSAIEEQLTVLPRELMASIDRAAAKHFAVFLDDAFTNGYGFQAHLIETEMIPKARAAAAELRTKRDQLRNQLDPPTRALIPKKWNWRESATMVGMAHEYDFIYSYTSKLLHATPASITTNQPNLETYEVRTFLRYILVTLRSLSELIASTTFEDLRRPHATPETA